MDFKRKLSILGRCILLLFCCSLLYDVKVEVFQSCTSDTDKQFLPTTVVVMYLEPQLSAYFSRVHREGSLQMYAATLPLKGKDWPWGGAGEDSPGLPKVTSIWYEDALIQVASSRKENDLSHLDNVVMIPQLFQWSGQIDQNQQGQWFRWIFLCQDINYSSQGISASHLPSWLLSPGFSSKIFCKAWSAVNSIRVFKTTKDES